MTPINQALPVDPPPPSIRAVRAEFGGDSCDEVAEVKGDEVFMFVAF
jgi:hypothetical protein